MEGDRIAGMTDDAMAVAAVFIKAQREAVEAGRGRVILCVHRRERRGAEDARRALTSVTQMRDHEFPNNPCENLPEVFQVN